MKPVASIAIPVYNGENYLERAIQSVLSQTFQDFEIILSDNGSTDKTQEICERYASQDARIKYFRHQVNQGATWNFNFAFGKAAGDYFNWLAHDDELAPDYLEKCVSLLEADRDAVLCFSKVQIIDENSRPVDVFDVELRTDSKNTSHRFYDLLMVWHDCLPIFGLIRSSALRKTPLIGTYGLGDAILLARLGLLGPFIKIPAVLFRSRRHALQSNKQFNIWVDHHAYDRWFVNRPQQRFYLPQWEALLDLVSMVRTGRMGVADRSLGYLVVLRWAVRYRKLLVKDWTFSIRRLLTASRSSTRKAVS
jgi:glycosyltransferase involved in cell wall biosynthesis